MQIHKDNSIEKKKYEWKPNLKGQDYKQCERTFQEYDINCKVAPIFTLSMIYCTFGLKNNSDWKKVIYIYYIETSLLPKLSKHTYPR